MSRKLAFFMLTCTLAAVAAVLPVVTAAPQPDPANDVWQFDFEHSKPLPIMVKVPGEDSPKLYWYMTYKVTNNTGEDRYFVPEFTLYTNTGKVEKANKGINPAVFEKIKQVVGNKLLLPASKMNGKLLQGKDNAKTGVAIFKDFDLKAGSFDIYVGGLSSNTQTIQLPKPITVEKINDQGKAVKVKTDKIVLYKTLKLEYLIGVEGVEREDAKIVSLGQQWVMR